MNFIGLIYYDGIAIPYTKTFLDMWNYLKSGSVHSAVLRRHSFHIQDWPWTKKSENTIKFR